MATNRPKEVTHSEWRVRVDGEYLPQALPNRDVARAYAKATGGVPVRVVIQTEVNA